MATRDDKILSTLSSELLQNKLEQSAAIVTEHDAVDVDLALFKLLTKHSYSGIILCIDRPSSFYSNMLEDAGLNASKMYFIEVGFASKSSGNVTSVREPHDLTFMKIEVTRVAQRLRMKKPSEKIFFLNDGILTILQYTEEKQVGQLLHELIVKLREMNVYSITLLEPGQSINTVVERMSDKLVKLD